MHRVRLSILLCTAPLAVLAAVAMAPAQDRLLLESVEDTQRALAEAQAQGDAARRRAEQLETSAAQAVAAAERTAGEAAAVAARIQQSEADIAANEARITLVERQRAQLRARLAERQQPLVRLTAALQRLARRPAALSLLRPGSLREAVYLRAVLETMLPEVERRTAGLRAEIERGRALQQRAQATATALRQSERELGARRDQLKVLESSQRLASREASGVAGREADRALVLAEEARDLSTLVGELGRAGEVRAQLAALPGPVLRPARPEATVLTQDTTAVAPPAPAPQGYMLPLAGRLVAGFGDVRPGQPRSRGLSIAPRGGAQAVAPGRGRVVFAGPYSGYGLIVIIEHAGGWTSLVTGLADLDVRVGDQLVAGSPLGRAGQGSPVIALEVRRDGEPVNPLDLIG